VFKLSSHNHHQLVDMQVVFAIITDKNAALELELNNNYSLSHSIERKIFQDCKCILIHTPIGFARIVQLVIVNENNIVITCYGINTINRV
jgi:hypothetical protein